MEGVEQDPDREPPVPRRPKEAVFAPQTQPWYRKPNFPSRGKKRVLRVKAKQPEDALKTKRSPPRERHPLPEEAEEAELSDDGEDLGEDEGGSSSESDADHESDNESDDEDPKVERLADPESDVAMENSFSSEDEMDVDTPA